MSERPKPGHSFGAGQCERSERPGPLSGPGFFDSLKGMQVSYDRLMVFTGNANPKLAADVAQRLHMHLGRAKVGRFSDGEVMVELLEYVRGKDVFVLQSTCAPTNDNLMEVLVMVDALKRASAGRITAAMPYFGDRKSTRLNSSHQKISYAVFCLK